MKQMKIVLWVIVMCLNQEVKAQTDSITYAHLSRELTGTKYSVTNDSLLFRFDAEYNATGNLSYKIFSSTNQLTPVQDGTTVTLPVIYGDNRFKLSVSGLSAGKYVLEVENAKREKFYLRFVK